MKKTRKRSALLLVTLLIMGVLAGCTNPSANNTSSENVVENRSTDVVIIGSGGAGLAAAVEAKNAGKDVIIVEKMPMVGGNTLRATGGLNAAGTSPQAALGIEDSAEAHYADTMKGGYDKNDPELVKVFTEQGADAVEWLIGLGADLSDVGRLAGASENRAHRPTGGAPVGAHIVQVLRETAEKNGIEILLNTTATEIVAKEGKVTGVVVEDKDGNTFTIEAKAVVVATGGFGSNTTMITEYDKALDGFGTTNHSGATGDGITMAVAVGGALVDMEEIQTHPTVVPSNGYMITEAVRGNGAILVNRDGKRFVSELQTRDVVSEATLEQEGKTAFLFFDEGVKESLSAIDGYIKMGLVVEGETIEELAGKLEIDAEALAATVAAYNGYVAANEDKEFGRADMPRALETGKFYAIEVGPAVHHTMGGLKINTRAQVLDAEGNAIEGLYAAGEVTGGIHGGNRLGGNALTDLIVFGRIAGQSVSEDL